MGEAPRIVGARPDAADVVALQLRDIAVGQAGEFARFVRAWTDIDRLVQKAKNGADFTLTFRRLADDVPGAAGEGATRSGFADPAEFDAAILMFDLWWPNNVRAA